MLSVQQVRHVLQYYLLDMMESDTSVPTHVHRDCLYMNKARAELCSEIFSNPILRKLLQKIHNASHIHQINSVPINSTCYIEGKNIPFALGGTQLIIYHRENDVEHLCILKKYQRICYYYFKLRHLPDFIKMDIKTWLNKQSWYIPKACTVNLILKRLLESNLSEKIHVNLCENIEILSSFE